MEYLLSCVDDTQQASASAWDVYPFAHFKPMHQQGAIAVNLMLAQPRALCRPAMHALSAW